MNDAGRAGGATRMDDGAAPSALLRAVVVEDEPHYRDALLGLVADCCPSVRVAAVCGSVAEAVAALRAERVDLLFLDVELPDGTGFEVLERVDGASFRVIFTTAHAEHAVRAIKCAALDYLVKPVLADELRDAVAKAQADAVRRRAAPASPADRDTQAGQIRLLREHLAAGPGGAGKIVLPTQEGLVFIELRDIVWCEARNNYTAFHLANGRHTVASRSMKEFEELLDDHGFFRIHHSHLVNLMRVARYVRGKGGYVVMDSGKELEVSVRRRDEFLDRIGR